MTQDYQDLYKALSKIETPKEAERFVKDLLTPDELDEFSMRFQIAKSLWKQEGSYAEIATRLKTSTTTVTRVARFLWKEPYHGYQLILQRLFGKRK